jgi:exonuclease III
VAPYQQGKYKFFHGKWNENNELDTGFLYIERIISAVKSIEFVSDRMSYIILRSPWCHVIVLNVHTPRENKIDYVKDSFYEELEHIFNKFHKYHMKFVLGDFNAKTDREDIFKLQSGRGKD